MVIAFEPVTGVHDDLILDFLFLPMIEFLEPSAKFI